MNKDILKVYHDKSSILIDGRELYGQLNISRDFPTWINSRLTNLKLIENVDYFKEYEDNKNLKRKRKIEYKLTLETCNKILDTMKTSTCSNEEVIKFIRSLNNDNNDIDSDDNLEVVNEEASKSSINADSVEIFSNNVFGSVRTVSINDTIYFVANDVAKALMYVKYQAAIKNHCKGVLKTNIPTGGGAQTMNVIPESDVYRLISKSKMPKAIEFEKWIFEEVLPTVNKHGIYATDDILNKTLNDPDYMIQILQVLKQEREEKQQLAKDLEVATPMLNAYNDFLNDEGLYSFSTAAKILCIPRVPGSNMIIGKNTLLNWLRKDRVLAESKEERNIPYQRYVSQGIFKLVPHPTKENKELVKITSKGLDYIYRKYRYTYMPKNLEDNIQMPSMIFEDNI